MLLGGSALTPAIERDGLEAAASALDIGEELDLTDGIVQPERTEKGASGVAVIHEPAKSAEPQTLDLVHPRVDSSGARPARYDVAMSRPTEAWTASAGLTAPGLGGVSIPMPGRTHANAPYMATAPSPLSLSDMGRGEEAAPGQAERAKTPNAAGTGALGNTSSGVYLDEGNGNQVGFGTGGGNRIAFNGNAGVIVDAGVGNFIRQNEIYFNGGLGIDLVNGGNNNQAASNVTKAISSGATTTVSLTLTSAPNTTFNIEVFSNAACDPSGFGEGEVLLGTTTLTTGSTGTGSTSATFAVGVPTGHVITATATSTANNTSGFSNCMSLTSGAGGPQSQAQTGTGTPLP
jgi:hypothetical protein